MDMQSNMSLNKVVQTICIILLLIACQLNQETIGAVQTNEEKILAVNPKGASNANRPDRLDPRGRYVTVTDVENETTEMPPDLFWKKINQYASGTLEKPKTNLWADPVLRLYFFGELTENKTSYAHSYNSLPPGKLESEVTDSKQLMAIGIDLPNHPILTPHNYDQYKPGSTSPNPSYSTKYAPRREGEYAMNYMESYLLTGDASALNRAKQLLDWVLYSQYVLQESSVVNQFVMDYYPQDAARAEYKAMLPKQLGAYDCDYMDFVWIDDWGKGYRWKLHEGDHHVNALQARALVKGYELTGDKKYLNSAQSFVQNQFPRYGFHTGKWEGDRYYWTEYNPTGDGNPIDDDVNNVQALVALASAMVGYHTHKPAYLEFARGLLWKLVMEYNLQYHRLYYTGSMKHNNVVGPHTSWYEFNTLKYGFEVLPYLAAGAPSTSLSRVIHAFGNMAQRFIYLNEGDWFWFDASNHPLAPARSKSQSEGDVDAKDRRYVRSWRVHSAGLLTAEKKPFTVSTFIQLAPPMIDLQHADQAKSDVDANPAQVKSILDSMSFVYEDRLAAQHVVALTLFRLEPDEKKGWQKKELGKFPYSGPMQLGSLAALHPGDILLLQYQAPINDVDYLNLNSTIKFCIKGNCYSKPSLLMPIRPAQAVAIDETSFLSVPSKRWFPSSNQ